MKQLYAVLTIFSFHSFLHTAAGSSQPQEKLLPSYLSAQLVGVPRRDELRHAPIAVSRRVQEDRQRTVFSYVGFVSGVDRETISAVAQEIEKSIQAICSFNALRLNGNLLLQALKNVINTDSKRLAKIVNDGPIHLHLRRLTAKEFGDKIQVNSFLEHMISWTPRSTPQPSITEIKAMSDEEEELCKSIILPARNMHLLQNLILCNLTRPTQEELLKNLHTYAQDLYNDEYERCEPSGTRSPNKYAEDFAAEDPYDTGMEKVPVLVVNFEKHKEHVREMLSKKNK